MKSALVAAFLTSDASARFFFGKCPKPEPMAEMDVNQYAGTWYGQEVDWMFPFTLLPSSCDFKRFTKNDDGNLDLWFGANSNLMGPMGVNGELFCNKETFVNKDHNDTCEANMAGKNQHKPFAVLYTDYSDIDVGYYCMELLPDWIGSKLPFGLQFSTDIATIYSRDQNISAESLERARKIIQDAVPEYNWDISRMRGTSQEDTCQYKEVQGGGWKQYVKEAKNAVKSLIQW